MLNNNNKNNNIGNQKITFQDESYRKEYVKREAERKLEPSVDIKNIKLGQGRKSIFGGIRNAFYNFTDKLEKIRYKLFTSKKDKYLDALYGFLNSIPGESKEHAAKREAARLEREKRKDKRYCRRSNFIERYGVLRFGLYIFNYIVFAICAYISLYNVFLKNIQDLEGNLFAFAIFSAILGYLLHVFAPTKKLLKNMKDDYGAADNIFKTTWYVIRKTVLGILACIVPFAIVLTKLGIVNVSFVGSVSIHVLNLIQFAGIIFMKDEE